MLESERLKMAESQGWTIKDDNICASLTNKVFENDQAALRFVMQQYLFSSDELCRLALIVNRFSLVEAGEWTAEDTALCESQGWSLFKTDHGECIQSIDEPANGDEPVFKSDHECILFVLDNYFKGCKTATKALRADCFY